MQSTLFEMPATKPAPVHSCSHPSDARIIVRNLFAAQYDETCDDCGAILRVVPNVVEVTDTDGSVLRAEWPAHADALTVSYEAFRREHPALRCFQPFTSDQRADLTSSRRVGHVQRQAIGEHYYTHPLVPGVAFPSARRATTAAYAAYLAEVRS